VEPDHIRGQFRKSVVDLLAKIDGVIDAVRPCANIVEQIGELVDLNVQARQAVSKLRVIPPLPEPVDDRAGWMDSVHHVLRPSAADKESDHIAQELVNLPTDDLGAQDFSTVCAATDKRRIQGINELTKQIEVRDVKIHQLRTPFPPAEEGVRRIAGDLQAALRTVPVRPEELRTIRS
jgi:hypothetical protein